MKYLSILFLTLFIYSCGSGDKSSSSATGASDSVKTDTSSKKTTETSAATAKPDSGATASATWRYPDETDKMTSKKKYYAEVDAKDLLNFEFPYDGGSTATLTIRNAGTGNESLLNVSKGQFNTSVDGSTIKIRFDSEQPVTFRASSASDGSTDVIFIENTKKLISKLKSAKKIIIQAEFFEAGLKEMEFSVADFKWNH